MPQLTEGLIDHALIDHVNAKLAAAKDRLQAATEGLAGANDTLASATAASDLAAKGKGEVSPHDAELAIEQAERALRVAQKVHDAASTAHRNIAEWAPLARGAAHGQLYMAGIRARIAAAKKADAARALMKSAQQDLRAAISLCNEAYDGGHMHIAPTAHNRQALISLDQPIGSWLAEEERNTEKLEIIPWQGHNVDPLAPASPWAKHIMMQEPEDA